jgi:DNA repair protein RadA/Sms
MAKDKIAYVCENCGQESAKWIGKCPSCNEWNTFREIRIKADSAQQSLRHVAKSATAPLLLKDIPLQDVSRMDMHDEELNRVLGGGLVPGSIVLLGGDPGIGKSTLTLQTIMRMPDTNVLYVSGEESAHQLKLRADRIDAGFRFQDSGVQGFRNENV